MTVVNFKHFGSVEALQEKFGENWRYVGRAMPHFGLPGSPLGNPYRLDEKTDRKTAVELYKQYLWGRIKQRDPVVLQALQEIGEDTAVVCWCAPDACHGDVVVKAAAWLRENGNADRTDVPNQVPVIKVITLWQPWAQLMALGLKRFETRSWSTDYRGVLAIHAAKRSINWREVPIEAQDILAQHGYDQPGDFAYQAIVGAGNLTGCYKTPPGENGVAYYTADGKPAFGDVENPAVGSMASLDSYIIMPPPEPELYFGNYEPDRYAWHVPDLKPIQPLGCRGMQGLWTAPDELAQQIWARYQRAPSMTRLTAVKGVM